MKINNKFEDRNFNTYENTVAIYGDFDMPVPTYVINKKIDFKIILAILLRSNSNTDEDDYRYIDANRLDKDAVCRECNITRGVLNSKINYLKEVGIISIKNSSRGMVYIINYSKDGKYYVSISHKILKRLYDTVDNNTIKTYFVLVVQCKYLNNRRPMSNAFLCSQLGYSTKATNNLAKIGKSTNKLHEYEFIKKRKELIYEHTSEGMNAIQSTNTYYSMIL